MAFQRCMGFEFGDLIDLGYASDTEFFVVSGTPATTTAQRHRSGGGWGGNRSLRLQAGDEIALFTYANDVLFEPAGAYRLVAGLLEVRFRDNPHTTTQCAVTFDAADGKVRVYRGDSGGTLIATSAGAPMTLSTWHWVEYRVTAQNAGTMQVYVDGVLVVDTGVADLQPGVFSDFDFMRFVGGTACDCYLDDLVFAEPGTLVVGQHWYELPKVPIDDSVVEGVPSTGSDNWAMVDEDPPDTADYVTFTDTDMDLYTLSALAGSGATVGTVRVAGYAEGEGSIDEWSPVVKSGAATQVSGAHPAEASWRPAQDMVPQDPDTGLDWELAAVEAMTAGVQMADSGGGGLG